MKKNNKRVWVAPTTEIVQVRAEKLMNFSMKNNGSSGVSDIDEDFEDLAKKSVSIWEE